MGVRRCGRVALAMAVGLGLLGCGGGGAGSGPGAAESAFPSLTGPYLGQQPPGRVPELFAPGIVSTGLFTRDMAVSVDGLELFFTVAYSGGSSIMTTSQRDGAWSEPEVAPFSGRHREFEPCLSRDGARLLFLSNRPPPGQPEKPGWGYQNIWMVERDESGWGEPAMVPPPVSTDANEFFPSLTREGTLYFTRGEDQEHAAIYRSRLEDGVYRTAERLPSELNTTDLQYNAFIDTDESLLLFSSNRIEGGFGGSDCYVAFRSDDDTWSGPFNLGGEINDEGDCDSAMVTPDGRYLFFMSTRRDPALDTPLAGLTLRELQHRLTLPGNGSADIYWVDAGLVEELRPGEQ